jgi:hypothetical protein
MKDDVDLYLNATMDARALCERDRDYIDGKQWTDDEAVKLRKRGQAPVVINRLAPKHNGMIGLLDLRRTDPKAFPRTKKHEDSAHAISDALRYVADNNDFINSVRLDMADNFFCEGTAAAFVDVEEVVINGRPEMDVKIKNIAWDRFYYDPYSRRLDFADARFMGMIVWMGFDEFTLAFPDADINDLVSLSDNSDDTFSDKPQWIDKKKKRIRVCHHFYLEGGEWMMCYFTDGAFLIDPQTSPFLDEDGDPSCPIVAQSAHIDRDNNRYGEVRNHIDKQDELNHRRSKGLFLLSRRQTYGRKGVATDIQALKREAAKPDGHLEFPGGEVFGKDFGFIDTADMAAGQLAMYQDTKAELDSVGFNAQLAGERQSGDISGKAINMLQQAGTIELNRQYTMFSSLEKRIYRQIWGRIKQYWTDEKWIRITDDQDDLKWVGLNAQVTAQEWLQEQVQDESLPIQTRRQADASLQFLTQAAQGPDPQLVAAAQQGDQQAMIALQQAMMMQPLAQQKLQEIVEVKNPVPEMDVDIIIDQSFDVINTEQETFQLLAQFAQGTQEISFIDLLEVSPLRNKKELIERIEKRQAAAQQQNGNLQQMQVAKFQTDIQKTQADTAVQNEAAMQKRVETILLTTGPKDKDPQVIV